MQVQAATAPTTQARRTRISAASSNHVTRHEQVTQTAVKTAEFQVVTPDMAAEWLKSNTDNRSMRGWWASALAAMIRRDDWITTHQGVAFSASGRLIDGQHRLAAIVESGISAELLVVRGISDEAFKVIDTGVKRDIADITSLDKRAAEVCRKIVEIQIGMAIKGISAQMVIDIANAGFLEIHNRLIARCPTSAKFYSSTSMRLAACILVADGCNEKEVFETYANLVYQRYEILPPVALGLVRQVNSNIVTSSNPRAAIARGLKALNPNNASLSKIQISEAEQASLIELVKQVAARALLKSAGQ